jgi:dolichyl-diphosphooligosaccharide--protein glycosyltransferase
MFEPEKEETKAVQSKKGSKDKKSQVAKATKQEPKMKFRNSKKTRMPLDGGIIITLLLMFTTFGFVYHSTMLAAEAYSSPSIIMSGRRNDGSRYIIDDYREAYYWIK